MPSACTSRGHPLVVGQLLCRGDAESRSVLVPVDVVGLDRVEALVSAHPKAGRHDRLKDGDSRRHVEPPSPPASRWSGRAPSREARRRRSASPPRCRRRCSRSRAGRARGAGRPWPRSLSKPSMSVAITGSTFTLPWSCQYHVSRCGGTQRDGPAPPAPARENHHTTCGTPARSTGIPPLRPVHVQPRRPGLGAALRRAALSVRSATRSVASCVPASSRRESCARRKNSGASCSQVAPIPPCTSIIARVAKSSACPAADRAALAASGNSSGCESPAKPA